MMPVSTTCAILVVTFLLTLRDAVKAETEVSTNVTVAIQGGGPHGRLIVTAGGKSGRICLRKPSNAIAVVICKELGWNTTMAHITHYENLREYIPAVLDDVYCTGEESSLVDCTYNANISNRACSPPTLGGIDCSPEITVKVVNQSQENGHGLLITDVNGLRGVVCAKRSTDAVAKVVCRELGWNDTTTAHVREVDGYSSRLPVAMSDVICTGEEKSLGDCSFVTHSTCAMHGYLGVFCPQVTTSIAGGGLKGNLTFTVNGQAAYFNDWSRSKNAVALAACRGMGWNTSVAQVTRVTGVSITTSGPEYSVSCKGYENSMAHCKFYGPYGYETFVQVFQIDCSAERKVKVAISGGGNRGSVSVKVDTQKGYICREGATDAVAAVACRQMGWNTTRARIITSEMAKKLNKAFVMFDVKCTGAENSLADCTYSTAGDCSRYSYRIMGIDCSPEPTVSLSVLGGRSKGTLIATVNGQPGLVCKVGNQYAAMESLADVACRELGLDTRYASLGRSKEQTNYSIVLEDVYCTGLESSWDDCIISVGSDCTDGRYYGISCATGPVRTFAIQGGGPKGLLLATTDGKTGTVCVPDGNRYYDRGAKVACRQLGWHTPSPRLSVVPAPINLTTVFSYSSCDGNERTLEECDRGHCNNEENDYAVEIDCSLVMSLVNSFTAEFSVDVESELTEVPTAAIEGAGNRGRLIVNAGNRTGRICSKNSTDAMAAVVCRELGWNTSRITKITKMPRTVVVDDAYCLGNESKLADCKFITWESCDDSWDFEIDCSPVPANVTLAIEGGGHKGRLIATVNGKTGTVCRHGATHDMARVVCRELGWKTNIARIVTVWTPSALPIVMDEVHCTGNETGLADCQFVTATVCSHIEDVGIECSPDRDNPCEENPCQNGGTCVKDGAGEFHCVCPSGVAGSTCNVFDQDNPCEENPCQNGGTCVNDGAGEFHCVCPPGVAGSTCNVFDSCSLSYRNKLTTFAGETAYVSVPCAYDLVSVLCGDYHVKVQGKSEVDCLKKRCHGANETHVISSMDVSVKSDEVSWKGKLKYGNFKLNYTVSYGESLVSLTHDRRKKTTVLVTTDNVLSLTMSRDDGIKVTCANLTSSAEYPTSLCGAGKSDSVMIKGKTKELNFTETSETVAFDILTNPDVKQRDECRTVTATLFRECQDRAEAIQKCSRCFRSPSRTRLECLKKCLPRRGGCKQSP